jgi:hypothetical protein
MILERTKVTLRRKKDFFSRDESQRTMIQGDIG